MSLFTALQELGFNPYHMAVALDPPKSSFSLWIEALRAKFNGEGKKWGHEEFDKILGNYDGIADVPGICFSEELINAYPDAKIVLNTRDVDAWLKSMRSTATPVLGWKGWDWIAPWDPNLCGPWWYHCKIVMPIAFHTMTDFSPNGPARQAFKEHYDWGEASDAEGETAGV